MSQHWLEGMTATGSVKVLVGWDQPLAYFFMVIESGNDDEEPLYSNLYEHDPASLTLEHFQKVLDRFGIENVSLEPGHEQKLYEKLMADKENGR